ncbi:MAG: ISAs1 family transposase [Sulfurimonas sp.]|nr:ISAs1 family transposase [Sulfurimonas sp.]
MKLKQKKLLLQELKTVKDFRVDKHKILYPLHEILFMTLFSLLKGNTTFKEMHLWMEFSANNKILKKVFDKKEIAVPCKSTLHRILMNIDNNELEKIFRRYFKKFIEKKNIAVDGKWLNGSDINAQYKQQSHNAILNILDKDTKIVFAHRFLEHTKKSEIAAFEGLLKDNFFADDEQIFSFDALLTQSEILNTIDTQGSFYIAKVKGNQKLLKEKVIDTVNNFINSSDSFNDENLNITERDCRVTRVVDIFENRDCDRVLYHPNFNNIQSIIRVTKTSKSFKTGEIKTTTEYLIANYKADAQEFREKILQHWRVETYHYHLDNLMEEDDHIAYVNPFSISILRSFALNLYQIYFNSHKDEKILSPRTKTTMANISHCCKHDDLLVSNLLEQ